MRKKEQIKHVIDELTNVTDIKSIDDVGFIQLTGQGAEWHDCLSWVYNNGKMRSEKIVLQARDELARSGNIRWTTGKIKTNFAGWTSRGEHWFDCLSWVLGKKVQF